MPRRAAARSRSRSSRRIRPASRRTAASRRSVIRSPGTTGRTPTRGLNWLADVLTDGVSGRTWRRWRKRACGRSWAEQRRHEHRRRPLARRISASAHAQRRHAAVPRARVRSSMTNVNAMARVGLLFLRKGMWKDQRVSERGVRHRRCRRRCRRTPASRSADPTGFPNALTDYGVLWWTNKSGQHGERADGYLLGVGTRRIADRRDPEPRPRDRAQRRSGRRQLDARRPHLERRQLERRRRPCSQPFLNPIVAATTP